MKSRLDLDSDAVQSMLTRPAPTAHKKKPAKRRAAPHQPLDRQVAAVSIVIPHLNAPQLDACLASIYRHGAARSFEIIVVFDGSPETDVRQVETRYRDIRAQVLPRNGGFARACNAGAAIAKGKYLIFLNDDTTVTAGWLDRLVDFIESDRQIGIAGPKLLYPESDQIQHCGTVFNEKRLGEHIYRHIPGDFPAANRPRNFRAITGACIIVEREFFLDLGGFDSRFHRDGGCEDTDLCFKTLAQGRTVTYCPDSIVYHHEGVSRGVRSEFHPEEIYNQKLLRRRWEKFLTPDDAEYDLLAEIEAAESASWRWLRDVPGEAITRQCKKLHAERRCLVAERDSLAVARETLAHEQAAAEARFKTLARERDGLAAERDRVVHEQAAAETRFDALTRDRDRLTEERDRGSLEHAAIAAELDAVARTRDDREIELDALARERGVLAADRDRLARERAAIAVELDLVARDRDGIEAELGAVARERDALSLERDVLARAQAAVMAELDMVARERDGLEADRDRRSREHRVVAAKLEAVARERDALSLERDRSARAHAAVAAELDAAQSLSDERAGERDDLALAHLQLRRERDALAREFDAARVERERLTFERNAVAEDLLREVQRRQAVEIERDAVRSASDELVRERDDLVLARFQLRRERDAIAAMCDELSRESRRFAQERNALAEDLWRETQLREAMERAGRCRLGARLRVTLRAFLSGRWRPRPQAVA